MTNSKIESYLGFALKANKVLKGQYLIENARRVFVVISCESASPRSRKEAVILAKRFKVPIFATKGKTLEDIVNKKDCKMIAVTDESLGRAIIDCEDESFEKLSGEESL